MAAGRGRPGAVRRCRRAEASFRDLLVRACPVSVPVGLAVVVADGALRGMRLYVGVEQTSLDALASLTTLPAARLAPFYDLLGPFRAQFVTAAFDFALVDGVLHSKLARTKLDAYRVGVGERSDVEALASAYGLDPSPLLPFSADLDECFGGSTIQYLGVGCRGDTTEVTVYAHPAGLERA